MFKISILVVAFLLIGNARAWTRDLVPNPQDHQEGQEGNPRIKEIDQQYFLTKTLYFLIIFFTIEIDFTLYGCSKNQCRLNPHRGLKCKIICIL